MFGEFKPGRKSGKTQAAIDWVLKDPHNRLIVVPTYAQAQWTRRAIHADPRSRWPMSHPPTPAFVTSSWGSLMGTRKEFILDEPWRFRREERMVLMTLPGYAGAVWGDLGEWGPR